MIYIVGRAHKASVKDGIGIFYQCISKNGIAHAAVIILNIKFYLFSTVSISFFPSNILGLKKKHDTLLLKVVTCQCTQFLIIFS